MSTIGGLLMPRFDSGDYGQAMNRGILGGSQIVQGQTALLALAEEKQKQAAQQAMFERIQNDPELRQRLFGDSILGSLGAAPGAPGGAPGGASGGMPGPPDASRFAGVPPQSGGPIPPNVLGQVTPQVTPPPGTPTLATIGPQQGPMPAPPNPLMELVRRDPRAGLLVQQQMQGQQDLALKRDEQRLTMGTRIAEYIGRVAQGVTSPETLEQARQEMARVAPQAAAQLPQTYSKEAMRPFIEKALSVKDSATVRLETWKNQIEEQKIGIQLQQAGYQGLGTDVTGILRGLTPEQVTEFGGRTSAKAIAYATDQVKKLDIEKREKEGLAGAQATAAAQQQARLDKTISEAFGERTTKLYDAQTGQTVDSRMKVKDYEAMPAGRVKELSTNQTEQMENVNTSIPVIAQLQTHIDKLYGPGGVLERMSPEDREFLTTINPKSPSSVVQQFMQKYPELTAAQNFIDSNAASLARALQGEKGAMAEGDVERAKTMLPNLKTALNVWPPAKLGMQLPDTRAVALSNMNSVVDLINNRVRTILGNDQFTHPKLHRYETAAEARASGNPAARPTIPPPPLPVPPVVGPNPNLPPPGAGGTPTPPAPPSAAFPPIRIPGEPWPPAPVAPPPSTAPPPAPATPPTGAGTRPAPPTATSTPAQDEAYRQSQGQGRPPAPVAPTPRPTPGRQSQAPTGTRLAGAPKYMELADVAEAMRQTGKSRAEVERRARELGYTVYGSKLKLPEVTMVG